VRTDGPARVLVVSAQSFRTLMEDVPKMQTKVLMALAARIPQE
jgi:CRP-like cAMP-binding protein